MWGCCTKLCAVGISFLILRFSTAADVLKPVQSILNNSHTNGLLHGRSAAHLAPDKEGIFFSADMACGFKVQKILWSYGTHQRNMEPASKTFHRMKIIQHPSRLGLPLLPHTAYQGSGGITRQVC